MRSGVVALALSALACSAEVSRAPAEPTSARVSRRPSPEASTTPPGPSGAPTAEAAPGSVASVDMIDDDLPRALAAARAEGKAAVFVDAWAPWCHTCLSMKHFVLVHPSLRALEARVVFAALDTDREENAAFVDMTGMRAWPTFYVLEAATGQVVDAWAGAASAGEIVAFVEGALDTIEASRTGEAAIDSPEQHFALAKQAELMGKPEVAAREYGLVLEKAPPTFRRRSDALFGLIQALGGLGRFQDCADIGWTHFSSVEGSSRPADFASSYLACAARLPDRMRHAENVRRRLEALAAAPATGASADDRADLLAILANAHQALGDSASARAAREAQVRILEVASAEAKSPAAAQTFDAARSSAYLVLGEPERAVQMLEERERQLPTSYEPPSRLSSVLSHLGRRDEALAALERALARSYGLVRPRLLARKAELLRELGRHHECIEALRAEVQVYESAPPSVANRRRLTEAKERLRRVERDLN